MSLTIRPFSSDDFTRWQELWDQNNLGQSKPDVTRETWRRLLDKDESVYGLGAYLEDGPLIAIMHYILHPVTGSLAPACYMQDLFTDPAYRGQGTARALLHALEKEYKEEKWARIYWIADMNNAAAQKLYQSFGARMNFSFHVLI